MGIEENKRRRAVQGNVNRDSFQGFAPAMLTQSQTKMEAKELILSQLLGDSLRNDKSLSTFLFYFSSLALQEIERKASPVRQLEKKNKEMCEHSLLHFHFSLLSTSMCLANQPKKGSSIRMLARALDGREGKVFV